MSEISGLRFFKFGDRTYFVNRDIPEHREFLEKYGHFNKETGNSQPDHILSDKEIMESVLLENLSLEGYGKAHIDVENFKKFLDRTSFVVTPRSDHLFRSITDPLSSRIASLPMPRKFASSTVFLEKPQPFGEETRGNPEQLAISAAYAGAYFGITSENSSEGDWRDASIATYEKYIVKGYDGAIVRDYTYLPPRDRVFLRAVYLAMPRGNFRAEDELPLEAMHLHDKAYLYGKINYYRKSKDLKSFYAVFKEPKLRQQLLDMSSHLGTLHEEQAPINLTQAAVIKLLMTEWQLYRREDPLQDYKAAEKCGSQFSTGMRSHFAPYISGSTSFLFDIGKSIVGWRKQGIGPWQVIIGLAMAAVEDPAIWTHWKEHFSKDDFFDEDGNVSLEATMCTLLDPYKSLTAKMMTFDLVMSELDRTWFSRESKARIGLGRFFEFGHEGLARALPYLSIAVDLVQFPASAETIKKEIEKGVTEEIYDDLFSAYLQIMTYFDLDVEIPGYVTISTSENISPEDCALKWGGLFLIQYFRFEPGISADDATYKALKTFCFAPTYYEL